MAPSGSQVRFTTLSTTRTTYLLRGSPVDQAGIHYVAEAVCLLIFLSPLLKCQHHS